MYTHYSIQTSIQTSLQTRIQTSIQTSTRKILQTSIQTSTQTSIHRLVYKHIYKLARSIPVYWYTSLLQKPVSDHVRRFGLCSVLKCTWRFLIESTSQSLRTCQNYVS